MLGNLARPAHRSPESFLYRVGERYGAVDEDSRVETPCSEIVDAHDAYPERACVVAPKGKMIGDLKGRSRGIGAWQSDAALYSKLMKGRLERERNRLSNCLQGMGRGRFPPHASDFFEPAQAELMELNLDDESSTFRHQIAAPTEDEYALAKRPRGRLKASKTKKRHTERAGESPRARRGSFGFVDIVRPRLFATAVGEHDAMCGGCFA
ncbi:hypothetical protein EV714DRAFT_271942 [Schizophyllum commune]